METTFHRRHLSFQIMGIIWALGICVFYKIALLELGVIARRFEVYVDVGFFKSIVTANGSSFTVYDHIFVLLLCSIVLQVLGFVFAIKEHKLDHEGKAR